MPGVGQTAEDSFSCPTSGIVSVGVCLGLTDFLPLGIGILGQVYQLAEILGCLQAVTCAFGSAGGPRERAEAVGGLLERSLELVQGSRRLSHLKQQLPQQFAERTEAILHRRVLEAPVFAAASRPHAP